MFKTAKQMAEMSGIGCETLRRMIKQNEIDYVQIGNRSLLTEQAMWDWYERNKKQANKPSAMTFNWQQYLKDNGLQITQERVADLKDVRNRVLHALTANPFVKANELPHSYSCTRMELSVITESAFAMVYERAYGEAMGLSGITLGDIVLYAVSRTLLHYPDLNAHYLDMGIRQFKAVNLAFACDTPRGLLVPTIFGATPPPLSLTQV